MYHEDGLFNKDDPSLHGPMFYMAPRLSARRQTNPFAHLKPLITKDAARAMWRPSAEIHTGLCRISWSQQALERILEPSPQRAEMLEDVAQEKRILGVEPALPSPPMRVESQPLRLPELPHELRRMVYSELTKDFNSVRPHAQDIVSKRKSSFYSAYEKTGLPALAMVFPSLRMEIDALLPELYGKCTFQFNFDDVKTGLETFKLWSEDCEEEVQVAKRISIEYMSTTSETWTASSIRFSLTSTGSVEWISEDGAMTDSACCRDCAEEISLSPCASVSSEAKAALPQSCLEIAMALREEDESLVDTVEEVWSHRSHAGMCRKCRGNQSKQIGPLQLPGPLVEAHVPAID